MNAVKLMSRFTSPGFIRGKVYSAEMIDDSEKMYGNKRYKVSGEDGLYMFVDDPTNSAIDLNFNFEVVPEDYVPPKYVDLKEIPTCDLVEELKIREGVTEHWVDPYVPYQLNVNYTNVVEDKGSAVILVVID